ncbi:MAG: cob(I)yrinic acid a,c-diamide adenosyltransferase [Bacteroidales bacterium]
MKGYIQVYKGTGKGKTTAAFGLAVRALCAGMSVYIGQFVKSMKYNEDALDKKFEKLTIEQLGDGCFIERDTRPKDSELAYAGLKKCREIMASGKTDLVILDEIGIAFYYDLLNEEDVIEALKAKDYNCEVVLTGRVMPESIVEIADLVTDMKEVKHYYQKGVLSRNGIDH